MNNLVHLLSLARQDSASSFSTKPVGSPIESCSPSLPKLLIHLDADRDGKIDNPTAGLETWTFGKNGRGAVIFCNNDNDNGKSVNMAPGEVPKSLDNANEQVDGPADVADLAPLVLRREPQYKGFPPSYKAVLSVNPEKIRIFSGLDASAKAVIYPGQPSHEIKDLSPTEFAYGMEATGYPSKDFDGIIELMLQVQAPDGTVVSSQKAVVRVAPWLMPNHLDETLKIYVVETGDNADFVKKMGGLGPPLEKFTSVDRWTQDVMEIGFSGMPRNGPRDDWHIPVVLRTANDRPKDRGYPAFNLDQKISQLLGKDFGYHEVARPQVGSSLDSFGNLECSPPVTVNGRLYPFGRIVYGTPDSPEGSHDPMRKEVRDFLQAQRLQKPFSVDTGWLVVGHVDEVFSFCPMASAPKKFKLVVASPSLAIKILEELRRNKQGGVEMFKGVSFAAGSAKTYQWRTPDAIIGSGLKAVQSTVQQKINGMLSIMKKELGLVDEDIIELPVLFHGDATTGYIAYTPGVANMLVVTKANKKATLVIPQPFGPVVGSGCVFEARIRAALAPTGNDVIFVDDFSTYHVQAGEVHCGTNSLRKPPPAALWWETEGI